MTKNFSEILTVAGVITVLVASYYVTGLYVNVLQIKKLKKELNHED